MKRNFLRLLIISFLFLALVMIRVFENKLFYDPFIIFYKSHNSLDVLTHLNYSKLIANTFFRYLLNTLISIAILYFSFKKKEIIKFSTVFYCIGFIILITAYTLIVTSLSKDTYQLFFYIRRFLIQPIFILLLLPAFYYQRINK
ncbi:MAG: exosortase F system-associated membrane protein [Flavobacteriaceae bacterium]